MRISDCDVSLEIGSAVTPNDSTALRINLAENSTAFGLRDLRPLSWISSNIVSIVADPSSDTSMSLSTNSSLELRVDDFEDAKAFPFTSEVIIFRAFSSRRAPLQQSA